MREIPQKGWCIVKEGNSPTVEGTKVYLDGKLIGGIQRLSLKIDAEKYVPTIVMEVVAFEGLVVDTVFGPPTLQRPEPSQDPVVFKSTMSPEEVLKAANGDQEPKDEIL